MESPPPGPRSGPETGNIEPTPQEILESVWLAFGRAARRLDKNTTGPQQERSEIWAEVFRRFTLPGEIVEEVQKKTCLEWAGALGKLPPDNEWVEKTQGLFGLEGDIPSASELVELTSGRWVGSGGSTRKEGRREARRERRYVDPDDAFREAQASRANRQHWEDEELKRAASRAKEQDAETERRHREAKAQQEAYLAEVEKQRQAEDEAKRKAAEAEWAERRARRAQRVGTVLPPPQEVVEPTGNGPSTARASEEDLRALWEAYRGSPDAAREAEAKRVAERRVKDEASRARIDRERRQEAQRREMLLQEADKFWQDFWVSAGDLPLGTIRRSAFAVGVDRLVKKVIEGADNVGVQAEALALVRNLATNPSRGLRPLSAQTWENDFLFRIQSPSSNGVLRRMDRQNLNKVRKRIPAALHPDVVGTIRLKPDEEAMVQALNKWVNAATA